MGVTLYHQMERFTIDMDWKRANAQTSGDTKRLGFVLMGQRNVSLFIDWC